MKNYPPTDKDGYLNFSVEQIDKWCKVLSKSSITGNYPLTLQNGIKMWLAPHSDSDADRDADHYRNKRGLDHIPVKEHTLLSHRTPVKLTILSDNPRIEYKRPCILDVPGAKYRALSLDESQKTSKPANKYGYSVDLGGTDFNDGVKEMILTQPDNEDIIRKWRLELIPKLPNELSEQIKSDNNFVKKLKLIKSLAICDYRQHDNSMEEKIHEILSSAF